MNITHSNKTTDGAVYTITISTDEQKKSHKATKPPNRQNTHRQKNKTKSWWETMGRVYKATNLS